MWRKKIRLLFYFLILFMIFNGSSAFAFAITGVFDVYAEYNSTSTNASNPSHPPAYPTAALDTGMDILAGDIINFNASGLWSESGYPLNYGPDGGTQAGWLFPHFSLVGKISDQQLPFYEDPFNLNEYFFIGSSLQNYEALANGRLFLAFNDSDYGNNAGYVTANVAVNRAEAIPEPLTLTLLGLGLLGFIIKKKVILIN